jgi:outer membrane protein OmpA-like peptidoglycan-associated protein
MGTVFAGAQASLPLPKESPIRLAAQGEVIGGLSKNQINSNYTDGYNYYETRIHTDFVVKLLQSLVLGTEGRGFKLHLNEGGIKSMEPGKENLLLLAGGLQSDIVPFFTFGVEVNSRTFLQNTAFRTDPVWITPTLVFKTPYDFTFTLGGDISASNARDNNAAKRSLEDYRLFSGILFSFGCLDEKRRLAAEKALRYSTEQAQCQTDVQRYKTSALSLMQKVKEDSAAAMRQKQANDSLIAGMARKAQQDSIALNQTLAEARRLLELEKERRTDIEKKLLTTGMLILDAVYFESNKSEISINSKPYLKIIGKMLERYPKLMLEVGGHTDNKGSAEKNQQLSQTRSEAVRDFLLQAAPTLAGRLTAMGYGPSQPKADNKTSAGRKANRRVELKVTNPDALKEYN